MCIIYLCTPYLGCWGWPPILSQRSSFLFLNLSSGKWSLLVSTTIEFFEGSFKFRYRYSRQYYHDLWLFNHQFSSKEQSASILCTSDNRPVWISENAQTVIHQDEHGEGSYFRFKLYDHSEDHFTFTALYRTIVGKYLVLACSTSLLKANFLNGILIERTCSPFCQDKCDTGRALIIKNYYIICVYYNTNYSGYLLHNIVLALW